MSSHADFLRAAKRAINSNGIDSQYKLKSQPVYNVETGASSQTETTINLKLFPKAVKVSQFNYPNLVGKEVIRFIALGDFGAVPSTDDTIIFAGNTYSIESFSEHYAGSAVVLYQILCVKV